MVGMFSFGEGVCAQSCLSHGSNGYPQHGHVFVHFGVFWNGSGLVGSGHEDGFSFRIAEPFVLSILFFHVCFSCEEHPYGAHQHQWHRRQGHQSLVRGCLAAWIEAHTSISRATPSGGRSRCSCHAHPRPRGVAPTRPPRPTAPAIFSRENPIAPTLLQSEAFPRKTRGKGGERRSSQASALPRSGLLCSLVRWEAHCAIVVEEGVGW